MIGYLGGRKNLDVIANAPSVWLRDLAFATAPLYVPDLSLVDGYLTWGTSDHASFESYGYPAIFFFEDSHTPPLHSHLDGPDREFAQ